MIGKILVIGLCAFLCVGVQGLHMNMSESPMDETMFLWKSNGFTVGPMAPVWFYMMYGFYPIVRGD